MHRQYHHTRAMLPQHPRERGTLSQQDGASATLPQPHRTRMTPPQYCSDLFGKALRFLLIGKEYSSDAIGDGPGGEEEEEVRDPYFGNLDAIDDNELESDEDEDGEDYGE
jgi:hypothetical protein